MNTIILVYLAYLWVGFLHSSFAGISLYALWGHKIKSGPQWVPILILFTFLALLEVYWIPIFQSLDLNIFIHSQDLQQHFNITEQTNIVASLRPNWLMVSMWILQTFFAYLLGNWMLQRSRRQWQVYGEVKRQSGGL